MDDLHCTAPPMAAVALLVVCALAAQLALANKPSTQAEHLAFSDFYKLPVGPRGLEPSQRLLALAGERVELTGYLVQGGDPSGPLIIAPMPTVIGDEDERFADDFPAAVAYLHAFDVHAAATLQACRGAVRVRGRLDIGRMAEDDGRLSFIRLQTDAAQCATAPRD